MNKISINVILPLVLIIGFFRNESPVNEGKFDLEGQCFFTVLNNTEDSIKTLIVNWYAIPLKLQEIDTTLAPNSSLTFTLISQNNNYYDLSLDNVKYKIFSQPGSVDSISIKDNAEAFSGNLKTINEFLLKKADKFNSIDADWLPRATTTGAIDNFEEIIKINDAITLDHINYVNENSELIPKWYRAFDIKRLKYLNAGFKLNSLLYRKAMLNMKDSVPENFLSNTIDFLPVSDESMLGNMRYMNFLNDYILFKAYPYYNLKKPQDYKKKIIEAVNKELDGKVKDVYLTFFFGSQINPKHAFDESWIDYIKDDQLRKLLYSELASNPVLPQGIQFPYFSLSDTNNVPYQPSQFKGKILLINFWATWCKPCIKEFPYENDLVERFKGEPVLVLNICIDSEPDKWKSMIKKYGLKTINLIAEDNWNKKLSKDFDIQALPHSVLVDWNGKVVQNKCPKASENSYELIAELLSKMKAE